MESSEEGGLSVGGSVGEENYFLGYTFTDRSHSSRVVKSIMDLCREDGLFADVTINVDSKEFNLHRLVLSAQSSFFRSMFTSNLKESHNRALSITINSLNDFADLLLQLTAFAAVHMDVIFIVAEGDSLVCYNPLLESFTRLRFPEGQMRLWRLKPKPSDMSDLVNYSKHQLLTPR
ncbi:unnamed protein product [Pleuronectes platessa]|uniref:BTB domain-containing protein n=1 Tax=Pleuronectes platessa TaxID=8262 RepID=A0A9N7YD01_PLEPL|nr:unnamed protein product [Pleuronectes platessa]